jgi:hypothetical protein
MSNEHEKELHDVEAVPGSANPRQLPDESLLDANDAKPCQATPAEPGRIPVTYVLSAFDELLHLLRESGARVTFDSGRNQTHPCTFCATTTEPRTLQDLGAYVDGDTLTRPVCLRCTGIVEARKENARRRQEGGMG